MQNRISVLIAVLVIALMGLSATDLNAAYVCGDADGNGIITISDAVYLIRYIFSGGPAPACGSGPSAIGTVTDVDGNLYYTAKIGEQWWMIENLRVTHYRNGEAIPNVTDGGTWEGLTSGAYCNYNNDQGMVATHGRLYNWYAVADSRNIAPAGWHVPTDADWKQLEMYMGMSQAEADASGWRGTDEGGKLKEVGTTHWNPPNTGAINESGFSALPGGFRGIDGGFGGIGDWADLWSSTEDISSHAWYGTLGYGSSQVARSSGNKHYGFSVRCVRD